MNDPKKETPTAQANANDLTVKLKGRIKSHERIQSANGDFYANLLVIPSNDEYSHPKTFAVNASTPLGADGSEAEVKCELRPSNRKKDGVYFHNAQLWRYEEAA